MKILITKTIMPEVLNYLKKYFQIITNESENQLNKSQIIDKIKNCDGILCQLFDNIDKDIINESDKLKIIANCAAGTNNIDIRAASQRNIIVTNTPDVLTNATADLAFSLILAVFRRLSESVSFLSKGNFKGWDLQLLLGQELKEKTIGIIGAGRIGTSLVERTIGWKMNVLYYSRKPNKIIEKKYNGKKVDLTYLLKHSDIVSLHCPLTSETHHLIGRKELNLMKNTSILINTSRGAVVDEKALIKALKNNDIYGAGLDVFENEPEVPKELLDLNNAVCTPHIGSATYSARMNMAKMSATALIEFLINGKIPKNVVNN